MTVHSHCVESFEGLLQWCRRGRGCSELWKKNRIFPEHPLFEHFLLRWGVTFVTRSAGSSPAPGTSGRTTPPQTPLPQTRSVSKSFQGGKDVFSISINYLLRPHSWGCEGKRWRGELIYWDAHAFQNDSESHFPFLKHSQRYKKTKHIVFKWCQMLLYHHKIGDFDQNQKELKSAPKLTVVTDGRADG